MEHYTQSERVNHAMSRKQQDLIAKLEQAAGEMVWEYQTTGELKYKKYGQALCAILEQLPDYPVMAVLAAEEHGLDKRLIDEIRKVFDVRI